MHVCDQRGSVRKWSDFDIQIIDIIPYHDILYSYKELIDLDTYLIDNPDDGLCTISAHELISKLIHFLNWETNLNANATFDYL